MICFVVPHTQQRILQRFIQVVNRSMPQNWRFSLTAAPRPRSPLSLASPAGASRPPRTAISGCARLERGAVSGTYFVPEWQERFRDGLQTLIDDTRAARFGLVSHSSRAFFDNFYFSEIDVADLEAAPVEIAASALIHALQEGIERTSQTYSREDYHHSHQIAINGFEAQILGGVRIAEETGSRPPGIEPQEASYHRIGRYEYWEPFRMSDGITIRAIIYTMREGTILAVRIRNFASIEEYRTALQQH